MVRRRAGHCIAMGLVVGGLLMFGGVGAVGQAGERHVDYHVDHGKSAEEGPPVLTVESPVGLKDVEVVLKREGDVHQSEQVGTLGPGGSAEIEIDQSSGHHHYQASVRGSDADGTEYDFELRFEVRVIEELEVELLRDDVDLDQGLIPVRVNRPVERVELQVADGEGSQVVQEERSVDNRRGRIDVEFDAPSDISEAKVTVRDSDGSWTTYTLEPFWVEIPQQVINFDTGDATVDDEAAARLGETRDKIMEAMDDRDEHRSEMRLYVAGYTDTVGPADMNLRLSEERAQSIARWFRDQGIEIPIYYQGFGQEVLAVETPDNTAEEQNRRAVYILGNTPPPTSGDIPRSNWQRLR